MHIHTDKLKTAAAFCKEKLILPLLSVFPSVQYKLLANGVSHMSILSGSLLDHGVLFKSTFFIGPLGCSSFQYPKGLPVTHNTNGEKGKKGT